MSRGERINIRSTSSVTGIVDIKIADFPRDGNILLLCKGEGRHCQRGEEDSGEHFEDELSSYLGGARIFLGTEERMEEERRRGEEEEKVRSERMNHLICEVFYSWPATSTYTFCTTYLVRGSYG